MNLPLLLLHLRRAASPWLGIALALVVIFLTGGDQAPESASLGQADPEQAARGLLRGAYWTTLALVLVVGVVGAAAGEQTRWREGEGLWSSTRRRGPLAVAASVWAGRSLGAWGWLLAIALVTELAAGGSAPSYDLGPARATAPRQADLSRAVFQWSADFDELPQGCRARARLRWLGDYSSVTALELRAWRKGGEPIVRRTRPGPMHLAEVDLPPGRGLVNFQLEALGAESRLGVDELTLELLRPADERLGALRVAASLALFVATLLALAMGLGSWMSAPSAVVLLAVSWAAAWLEGATWPVPGLELPRLLEGLSDGRVPGSAPVLVWLVGTLLIASGLALRVAALRKGVSA